jgi:hypothetical protein
VQRRIVAFASAVEFATGLALFLDPALVVRWLLDQPMTGAATPLARCFGVALLALGLACWPQARHVPGGVQPLRGLLLYNALIALYLGYLAAMARMGGSLIWPAVLLHAAVALSPLWTRRESRQKHVDKSTSTSVKPADCRGT